MATYEVRAQKQCNANFTITADSRKEAEDAIAEKLRPNAELVWTDDPKGVNAVCISQNEIWRIRRRFK
jgi:hypothetical protein